MGDMAYTGLMTFMLKAMIFPFSILPWRVGLSLGRGLGRVAYHIDRRHRSIAYRNLKESFIDMGEGELKRLVIEVFENIGMNFMEFARFSRFTCENIDRYVEFCNIDYLEQIRKMERGIIYLTAHLGNWELLAHAMAIKGYTTTVVVRKADSPVFEAFLKGWREMSGNTVIGKKGSMRRLIEILKDAGSVGILLDQNVTWREGVFVDFFGRPACTNKGAALLALATGAPVIPIFINRKEDGRHRIEVDNAIDLVVTGDRDRDVSINTERFTRVIEERIRKTPGQWFWVHQRWKSRPENDPLLKKRLDNGVERATTQ